MYIACLLLYDEPLSFIVRDFRQRGVEVYEDILTELCIMHDTIMRSMHIRDTVAVLGNGLDICYPKEHNKLMRTIEDNGLLLSEYPPGVQPQRYHFPKRNRIIAQWSDEIVVVAPENRSGNLITAEYAEMLGREVKIIS